MGNSKHLILYDSECSMCTFQKKVLSWLDWFEIIEFVPISSEKVREVAPPLTEEELNEAIHCVTPGGGIHRGARAIRFVGMRLPLLIPLALVMWLPGVIFIAEKVYQWVSRNRYWISKVFGCKEACSILPEKRARGRKDSGKERAPSEVSRN